MYERLAYQCADLDIAIVVNNAGVICNGWFFNKTPTERREEVVVNTYPFVLLTRALLPILRKRKN